MKKFVMVFLLVIIVSITLSTVALASSTEEIDFFGELRTIYKEYDCHIELALIDDIYVGVVLYGPTIEASADVYLYKPDAEYIFCIPSGIQDADALCTALEEFGLPNPAEYFDEMGVIDPFKLLEAGEELIFSVG